MPDRAVSSLDFFLTGGGGVTGLVATFGLPAATPAFTTSFSLLPAALAACAALSSPIVGVLLAAPPIGLVAVLLGGSALGGVGLGVSALGVAAGGVALGVAAGGVAAGVDGLSKTPLLTAAASAFFLQTKMYLKHEEVL